MGDRATWPTMPLGGPLVAGDNVFNMLAGAAVTKGQVVAILAAGVGWEVHPANTATTGVPIGIALNSASHDQWVGVAGIGTICYVQQETNDTDIDAGHFVVCTDTDGMVSASAGGTANEEIVGVLLEDSDASALTYERVLVLCGLTRSLA